MLSGKNLHKTASDYFEGLVASFDLEIGSHISKGIHMDAAAYGFRTDL
jgi:hypothetical protein